MYKDYVVAIQNKPNLSIALVPRLSAYNTADVILNGVEVFKLSDRDNNLGGPNPEGVRVTSPPQASTASESKTKEDQALRLIVLSTIQVLLELSRVLI